MLFSLLLLIICILLYCIQADSFSIFTNKISLIIKDRRYIGLIRHRSIFEFYFIYLFFVRHVYIKSRKKCCIQIIVQSFFNHLYLFGIDTRILDIRTLILVVLFINTTSLIEECFFYIRYPDDVPHSAVYSTLVLKELIILLI